MPRPTIGKKIKNFKAAATSDTTVELNALKGKKVVIYFYPKDSTPGCTTEGLDFQANMLKFKRRNTVVFGVSRDSLKSHENFRAKQGYKFELISDPDETLCKQFDVIQEKNMYGRKVLGIERSTFLIDEKGILRKEWRKVRVKGHVDDVLEAVKELG